MKATQIRVYLVAPVLAAVLGLGAHVAYAQPCITPAPSTVTVSSTNLSFRIGTATASCTGTTATFNVPAPPNNCAPPDPICAPLNSPPTFTGCRVSSSGFSFPATLVGSGTWQHCLFADGTVQLVIPQNGLTARASVLGQTCTTIAAPNGPAAATGTWNNTNSTATFSNVSVPVRTSGGFPCPSASFATHSAVFTANPAIKFQ